MTIRHLRRHFSELYQEGLLNIVGTDGKSNIYDLGNQYEYDEYDLLDEEEIYEFVEYELGSEVADVIQKDLLTSRLDIMNSHKEIELTPW
jgi:DNA-binding transcriptional ArsR family regulator